MDTTAFVKQLGSNSRVVRENALEKLHKFLLSKPSKKAKQLQFNKLWKGLYFAMWFSDRPRPQQRLANELGELHLLYFDGNDNANTTEELSLNDQAFIKFSRAFWKIICLEWLQIDRYRLDKYLLLMRRVLFNQVKYLQLRKWDKKLVDVYLEKVMRRIPLSGSPKVYNGIPLHIIDIVLDEWQRLFEGEGNEGDMEAFISETPLQSFIQIFRVLVEDLNISKVLRNKIKEDLFQDERLGRWGIPVIVKEVEEEEEDAEVEEWHGF